MPNNEEDTAIIGTILTGMIQFDQGITNSLIDSHLESAERWARIFQSFYLRISYALESGQTFEAYRIMEEFSYEFHAVPGAIEHFRSMRMNKED